MRGQAGFWDIDERYLRLSDAGDPLESSMPLFLGMFSASLWRKP
jgi:hypothetical protein